MLASFGGVVLDHVADANARLSIDPTGKTAGYRVIQDDGPTTYEFLGDGTDVDAGLWVTGAGTTNWNDAYVKSGDRYDGINNGGARIEEFSGPSSQDWVMGADYHINLSSTFPWTGPWLVDSGDSPPPIVARNPIASEANWTIVP